jgi:hypothetical protein
MELAWMRGVLVGMVVLRRVLLMWVWLCGDVIERRRFGRVGRAFKYVSDFEAIVEDCSLPGGDDGLSDYQTIRLSDYQRLCWRSSWPDLTG